MEAVPIHISSTKEVLEECAYDSIELFIVPKANQVGEIEIIANTVKSIW